MFIVLLFSLIGSIAWLVAGGMGQDRCRQPPGAQHDAVPEYERPGRHVPSNPDDDEEFLAGLRKRAEEQRRRAREQTPDRTEDDPNGPRPGEAG